MHQIKCSGGATNTGNMESNSLNMTLPHALPQALYKTDVFITFPSFLTGACDGVSLVLQCDVDEASSYRIQTFLAWCN